ncbi:MAG: GNAT family N-acetyltransferase [Candidatus Dormibacteraeota bacterium]|uniref:GNAT family N-acetyltransferase n=1 Tax=Candidatus Amunia macphersoniae TaxID=3127014 RepID=A0A934KEF8_9BACT|nr:GNAT family N-acetyltransferase [Candidatus Dormibacteraeota bacterium]
MISSPGVVGAPPAVPGLVIRTIRPDDASALQAFHHRLTPDTIRSRFFGAHPQLSDEEARRFTSLTAGDQAALVATVDDQLVGVGRYNRLGSGQAGEVAFVVEDGHQGHGIGTKLLTLLARIGWNDGIRRFVADTLAENHAMLDVFRRTPGAVTVVTTRRDGGVIHLIMAVTPPAAELTALEQGH